MAGTGMATTESQGRNHPRTWSEWALEWRGIHSLLKSATYSKQWSKEAATSHAWLSY